MRRGALAAVLLAGLALTGCADTPATGPAASGPRAATAADLLGRWFPADGTGQGRVFAEFEPDGSWHGSDGCNGQGGTWSLGPDGTVDATANPSTLIGCENLPLASWVATARRVTLDGPALVLRDGGGGELGRLVRGPA
ncbi:META domain-containing protein [Pseudonocardia phyllosphaerae]|uniref:hypothetical protein n=1 Tax=Pseudonocardia phyllosphaerae TaxID=3390502 RepID=UPI003978CA5E